MSRKWFSDQVIDVLKEIPIDEVADAIGLELDCNHQGDCPTGHDSENHKCFSLNVVDNFFKCFHCCNDGKNTAGDVIELVKLVKEVGFTEACRWLAKNFRPDLSPEIEKFSDDEDSKYIAKKEFLEEVFKANMSVANYYRNRLKENQDAIEYLKSRGLTEEDIFDDRYYILGYAPSYDKKLFKKACDKYSSEIALATGLFKCAELEQDENKSINDIDLSKVIPIFYEAITVAYIKDDKVKYFCARSIKEKQFIKAKTNARYSNARDLAFGLPSLSIENEHFKNAFVISEGLFDCISLIRRGIPSISAITVGFSKEYMPKVKKLARNKVVYICQDNELNKCGQKGAFRTAKELVGVAKDVRVIILPLPEGQEKIDVNDYFEKYGHSMEEFLQLKEDSKHFIDVYIEAGEKLVELAENFLDKISFGNEINMSDLKEKFLTYHLADIINAMTYTDRYDMLQNIKSRYFKGKKDFRSFCKEVGISEVGKEKAHFADVNELAAYIYSIKSSEENSVQKAERIRQLLMEDLSSHGRFYKDENNVPYYFDDSHKMLMLLSFEDKNFLQYLGHRNLVKKENMTEVILEFIKVHCWTNGSQVEIKRDWYYDDINYIMYIDMKNDKNQILKISIDSIDYVDNGADGVMFLKSLYASLEIDLSKVKEYQVLIDKKEDYFRKFLKTISFDTDDGELSEVDRRRLLWLYYYSLFFTSKNIFRVKPLLLLWGESGSGKTFFIQLVGKLLFGERWDMETPTANNEPDIDVALIHRSFLALDNVDSKVKWLEDWLATASTGKIITKRELFTTKEQNISIPNCFIALTARTPRFRRDDIADRLIIIKMKRHKNKIPTSELIKKVMRNDRVQILTETVLTIQHIIGQLKKYEDVIVNTTFRQSDFVNFAYKVFDCDEKILEIFKKLESEQLDYTSEFNPLVYLLLKWVQSADDFRGVKEYTADELYDSLKLYVAKNALDIYIHSPRSLAQQLSVLNDVLNKMFIYKKIKKKDRWVYSFQMVRK